MKFRIITLGCKVNQYDSQLMRENLEAAGHICCEGEEAAQIVIVNSCTVTATADQKTRQTVRRARRQYPDAVIVLTGCSPQAFPKVADTLAQADVVLGNSDRSSVSDYIDRFLESGERQICIGEHPERYTEDTVSLFSERTRAMLKIEDGCNRFCSYCIIPYARGRVRSKSLEVLRAEIAQLADNYCELVLVGINLSAYGSDIGADLADAVECAASFEKIKRVRLGSLEPDLLTDEMLARLAAVPKFCPQFHISLQSGCDATLRRMNRHYTADDYRNLCERLRSRFANCSITTDVMVGFPGEDEEEFNQSAEFARQIGFARTHVFAYSPREGTRAAAMDGQVSPQEKERRTGIMLDIARESEQQFLHSQVGCECYVLPEQELASGLFEGYSENYTPIHIALEECAHQPVRVRITAVQGDVCTGEII